MGLIINHKVYDDYRDNILFDKNNPILAAKANRDRFSKNGKQNEYAGLPLLASIKSEDALTWNVFKGFEETDDFLALGDALDMKINAPRILLWSLAIHKQADELQYLVGDVIRKNDGKYRGQITEPDVVIETDSHLLIFECKLGEREKYPSHLWGNQNSNGPQKRQSYYFSKGIFKNNRQTISLYKAQLYQLFRMSYYAFTIADLIKKEPILVSLTNKTWINLKQRGKKSPYELIRDFESCISNNFVKVKSITWQDLNPKDLTVSKYLVDHPCLFQEQDKS